MNEKPKQQAWITSHESPRVALGTIDSALVNCVSMLSALTEQRVEDLAGWLDLYYQIRYLWEVAQGNVTDRQLIRKDELLPILEATVRDALRGTARKAAETVTEKRKTRKPAVSDQIRSLSPSGSSPSQEEPKRGQDEAEPAAGPEPATETKAPGPWTLYKRKIFARLQQAREEGYTIAQIAEASGGVLSETKVIAAINATQLRQEEWRALETALSTVTMLQIPEGPEK